MNDNVTTIQELKDTINTFVADREWNQFHNAKNLSMAISAEAAELLEHFLWVDAQGSHEKMKSKAEDIEHEIADIVFMALCFCNEYKIDLATILKNKIEVNAKRYPVEKAKGNAKKYTEF